MNTLHSLLRSTGKNTQKMADHRRRRLHRQQPARLTFAQKHPEPPLEGVIGGVIGLLAHMARSNIPLTEYFI
jgi:hypothetical protein